MKSTSAAGNKTSEEVLKKAQTLIIETVPEAVIDRAHGIGNGYKDSKTNTFCKIIIVRFTSF